MEENSLMGITEVQCVDLGALFPKESTFRNVILTDNIKQVYVSCGCVTTSFKANSKVLTFRFKAPKEFPFQIEEDNFIKAQIVTVTLQDDTTTKIKLQAKILNPEKW